MYQRYQFCAVFQGCAPERGHVAIQINQIGSLCQFFHNGGQGHDGPAGERLDEQLGAAVAQPVPDMRNQPRFAAGVP